MSCVADDIYKPLLDLYANIMPDPDLFLQCLQQPQPVFAWVNTARVSAQQCRSWLADSEIETHDVPGFDSVFVVDKNAKSRLSKHWTFLCGLCHIQELASFVAGQVLNAQPGEYVLDLCAAPGNKSAQLALALQDRGVVIANDINAKRMRAWGQIRQRMGLVNIQTTVNDGVGFPKLNLSGKEGFDKILVDAPCTCVGTIRRKKPDFYWSVEHSRRISIIQKRLLQRAVKCCAPGGHILYSTCTFAPEENEAVVNAVLNKFSDELKIIPINHEGIKLSPGITRWENENFAPDLQLTSRVWPQMQNTGGFYMALLEKRAPKVSVIKPCAQEFENHEFDNKKSDNKEFKNKEFDNKLAQFKNIETENSSLLINSFSSAPSLCVQDAGDPQIKPYLDECMLRFGFPEDIFNEFVFKSNKKGIYILNQDQPAHSGLNVDAYGLFFIKTRILFPKLSTAAAWRWGGSATKNYVELNRTQVDEYIAGRDVNLNIAQCSYCDCFGEGLGDGLGYVMVLHNAVALGLGIYFPRDDGSNPIMRSLFPKSLQAF